MTGGQSRAEACGTDRQRPARSEERQKAFLTHRTERGISNQTNKKRAGRGPEGTPYATFALKLCLQPIAYCTVSEIWPQGPVKLQAVLRAPVGSNTEIDDESWPGFSIGALGGGERLFRFHYMTK